MGATGIKVTLTKDIAPALKKAQKLNEDGITVLIKVMTNIERDDLSFKFGNPGYTRSLDR